MVKPLSVSSSEHARVLFFQKRRGVSKAIQNFLKDIGIKRDYRKDFLKSIKTDCYQETSTKNNIINVSAFVGKEKIILRIEHHGAEWDRIGELMTSNFE